MVPAFLFSLVSCLYEFPTLPFLVLRDLACHQLVSVLLEVSAFLEARLRVCFCYAECQCCEAVPWVGCGGRGWDLSSERLDLHRAARKLWLRLLVCKFGGDCGYDCVMIAEGKVPGPWDGTNLGDDLSGAADVVKTATAHGCVVWVV